MNPLMRQIRPAASSAMRANPAAIAISGSRGYHQKDNHNDANVGTGLVGAPACGDVMKLQIRVDDNGIISDVKFKTFGCGSAIASSSYLTELVRGMSLDEAGKVKNTTIAKELSLPPVKCMCKSFILIANVTANYAYIEEIMLTDIVHCSMLAEDAIKSAIKDYKSKRAGETVLTSSPTMAATGKEATA
ncbi:NifU-like N terminal domain-containing protein [Lipomyces doorenjongii]|uniref:NifU-like N terminal domain-containing protein n=1 Tax=Lipomyces doorenjongii TaxID=383834 RepID=UPI0034CD098F